MPPRSPARAASCSKASSHCPGKARNGSIRDGFRSSRRKQRPTPGRWIPALRGNEWSIGRRDEPHHAARTPQRTLALAQKFHSLALEFPQTESRRVGTRRLPYVGDRVGGLGVRPPALGSLCGDYRRSPPECSMSIMPLSLRRGPHSRCIMPSRPRKPPRSAPPKRLSIAKRRF